MSGLPGYFRLIANAAAYRVDAFRWRRQLARFPAAGLAPHSETILFCDVVGSYAVSKAQSLYAVAFRQLGYDSIVLLDRPDRAIERNYRAAGVNQFYYLADLSPGPVEFHDRAEALIRRYDDLNDMLSLEIDDMRVGRNVLSKAVRRFRTGRLDNRNSEHRSATVEILRHSLAAIEGTRRLLGETSVRTAFLCERGYTPAGEVFDCCAIAGIDAIHWAAAPMNGTLLFKRYRAANRAMHPLSLSEGSWDKAKAMPWDEEKDDALMSQLTSHYETGAWYNRQQLQQGKTIESREAVHEALALDPKKKTAVIFCHILYDATFFYGESLFPDYQTWLVETVRGAIANSALNWVVKAHPVNVWRSRMDGVAVEPLELNAIRDTFGELPAHVRFMSADTPINTYSLFGVADYGLTVRGTIGLELPCFGIPVVTAGTGRYSGMGFTIDPESPEAYRSLLANLQNIGSLDQTKTNLARRYAFATLRWRPLPLESFLFEFNSSNRFATMPRNNVRLATNCPSDLAATPDLGRMSQWALETSDEDLLAPDADRPPAMVDEALPGALNPGARSPDRVA